MKPDRLCLPLRTCLETGIGLIYPNICQICHSDRAGASEGFVCATCCQSVRFITEPLCHRCGLPFEGEITNTFECSNCREIELQFEWARAAVAAKGVVLEVIHRYKYKRALWFESFLADLLVRQAAPKISRNEWDLIVPVPLHPLKKRQREFNQADRLARHLSSATHVPIKTGLLKRIEATATQTLLSRSERASNVRAAFTFDRETSLQGERIILVDDVLTTGATTSACARVLRRNGSGPVAVWTVARGL